MRQVQLALLVRSEQGHDDVDAPVAQRPDLVLEPVAAAGVRHDGERSWSRILEPIDLWSHRGVAPVPRIQHIFYRFRSTRITSSVVGPIGLGSSMS